MIPTQRINSKLTRPLSRRFIYLLLGSVLALAIVNLLAFTIFYNSFIRLYLSEKIDSRQDITLEYINNIIERQTLEDIDDIFSNAELEFFELLDVNDGKIPLWKEENVNIVVDFLMKSGVSPKYIEEIIPENNLEKVLEYLKDPESPESHFIQRLFYVMLLTNLVFLCVIFWVILYITRKIIRPINTATKQIQNLKFSESYKNIEYPRNDEIWLLISSLNSLNKKLSIQEWIRSRLLADISHELKTPISSIQCYLEGIMDGVISLSEKNLEAITSEMNRLITLVNQIMEFDSYNQKVLETNKQHYNLHSLLRKCIDTQKAILAKNNQKVVLRGSKNMDIYCDSDLFSQICYNLIGNFRKYAGENTTLTVLIESDRVIFQDNGSGIAKKELPFLFETFYQGKKEKTWNSSERGIGVGLSIVKKILTSHGWDSHIESDIWKWFRFEILFSSSQNIHFED